MILESSAVNTPVQDQTDKYEDDDAGALQKSGPENTLGKVSPAPRWPTRVFSLECMLKIMLVCEEKPEHFDMMRAKELHKKTNGQYRVL